MSKKKSAGSLKAAMVDENTVTRQIVVANYAKICKYVRCAPTSCWCFVLVSFSHSLRRPCCCRLIGVPVNTHVNDVLRGSTEEEEELVNVGGFVTGVAGSLLLGSPGSRVLTCHSSSSSSSKLSHLDTSDQAARARYAWRCSYPLHFLAPVCLSSCMASE